MYTEFLRYHRLAVIPVSDSADSPALDPSSLKSAPLDRSANVAENDIARRAYELYLARDCEDGHDVADWLQAERELQRERSIHESR
jgi:hypothetical protein